MLQPFLAIFRDVFNKKKTVIAIYVTDVQQKL